MAGDQRAGDLPAEIAVTLTRLLRLTRLVVSYALGIYFAHLFIKMGWPKFRRGWF